MTEKVIPILNRFPSFPRRRESSHSMKRRDTRVRGYDGKVIPILNRFSSFPHQRESSHSMKRRDTRIRGYDGKGKQAKVLIANQHSKRLLLKIVVFDQIAIGVPGRVTDQRQRNRQTEVEGDQTNAGENHNQRRPQQHRPWIGAHRGDAG